LPFVCSFSAQQCKDIFGPAFTEDLTRTAINWTNANYGGRGLRVTNVVFPNGSTDPWHALGIIANLSATATAIYIKGTFVYLLFSFQLFT